MSLSVLIQQQRAITYCHVFKLEKDDLHEEVSDIITIGDFYGLCDGDRTQIIFT